MNKINMSDQQVLELLSAPAMQIGGQVCEIEQECPSLAYEKERIRCANKEKAREAMFLARRCGIDAWCRGAVLFVSAAYWQSGAVEKLKIIGGSI